MRSASAIGKSEARQPARSEARQPDPAADPSAVRPAGLDRRPAAPQGGHSLSRALSLRPDAEFAATARNTDVSWWPSRPERPAAVVVSICAPWPASTRPRSSPAPFVVRMFDTHAVARSLTAGRVRSRPGGQRRGGRSAEDHRTPPAPPREAASDRRSADRVPAYGPPGDGAAPPGRILGPRVRRRAPRIRVDGVPLGSGPRAARPPSRSGGRIAGVVPREMPRLSDPARSWPERRGRRPRTAAVNRCG